MEATKRRPIRGVIYGIVLGLGLALIAIGQGWAALGTWPPFLLVLVGIVLGVVWSTVGPAKGAGGSDAAETSSDPALVGTPGEGGEAELGAGLQPAEVEDPTSGEG